jgi:hypothetical protein
MQLAKCAVDVELLTPPFEEDLKMLLDQEANLVLHLGDVCDIRWPGADRNLVVGKALAFIVARHTETL